MSACSMTGSAASSLFAPTTTTSRFMLKGKGRSLKWEVFLYDGMSIMWTVIVRNCCPGVCSRCRCATTVPGMVQTVQGAV